MPPSVSAVGEDPQNANSSTESVVRQASHSERIATQAPLPGDVQDEDSDVLTNSQVANEIAAEVVTEPSTLSSLSSSVSSQEPVEYFVSIALAGHPKIQAARSRVAATTNVIPQARSLPDPKFGNTFWPIHDQALQTGPVVESATSSNFLRAFMARETASQGPRLRVAEVQMARAEVDRIAREITEAVRLAYYEVWFATRAIAIIDETRELVNDLTKVAEARYKSGGHSRMCCGRSSKEIGWMISLFD